MFKRIFLDPLTHFLLIAVLFFVVYSALNPEQADVDTIVVTEARIEQLNNAFIKTWQREPTPKEINNAIHNFVLNEAYTREAKALGLDKNDNAIRKRLRQKMEYMLEDMSVLNEPSDQDLKAYYQQNTDRYKTLASYTFEQVYISSEKSPERLKAVIDEQLLKIANGGQPQGDSSMLAKNNKLLEPLVERKFGEPIVIALQEAGVNEWAGPVRSSLGYHFILLKERVPAKVKAFETVVSEVKKDWQYQQNTALKREFENQLLDKYQIDIYQPNTQNERVSAL